MAISPINIETDEFLWLEDTYGERPLEWVAEQKERTAAMLEPTEFAATSARVLEVLDSTGRIPGVQKYGS